MSATTIQIPVEHVEAIRRSLSARRGDAELGEEVERLLAQLAGPTAPDDFPSRELSGPRALLWGAVYDALCTAAEQLADVCNEYWRDAVEPDAARAGIAAVGARLELLVGLGPPPGR